MANIIPNGTPFGLWTVVALSTEKRYGQFTYEVRCVCGTIKVIPGGELRRGKTLGCRGCANRRLKTKHGHWHDGRGTPEYAAWQAMIQRCTNPTAPQYPNYGGRGIMVCGEWRGDFEAFYAAMGPRPSLQHSIDRVDNDGNYEPGNVRWALPEQQQRNRRNNRVIVVGGISATVTETATRYGLRPGTVFDRLRKGWTPLKAVTTPARGST